MTMIVWFIMTALYGFNIWWFIFAGLLWTAEFMTYILYNTQLPLEAIDD